MKLLDPKRLQDIVCSGKDIFGMLPEAYRVRFHSLFYGAEPDSSSTSMPTC